MERRMLSIITYLFTWFLSGVIQYIASIGFGVYFSFKINDYNLNFNDVLSQFWFFLIRHFSDYISVIIWIGSSMILVWGTESQRFASQKPFWKNSIVFAFATLLSIFITIRRHGTPTIYTLDVLIIYLFIVLIYMFMLYAGKNLINYIIKLYDFIDNIKIESIFSAIARRRY